MPDPNQPLGSTQKPLGGANPITSVSPVVVEEKPPKPTMGAGTPSSPPPIMGGAPPPPPPPPSIIGGPKPKKKPDKKVEPAVFPPGGKPKKKKGKIIATILGIFVLVGGVGVYTYLAQQQQDISEEAAGVTKICVEGSNVCLSKAPGATCQITTGKGGTCDGTKISENPIAKTISYNCTCKATVVPTPTPTDAPTTCTRSTRRFTIISSKITIIQSDFNKCPNGTLYVNRYKCPGVSTMPAAGCNTGGKREKNNVQMCEEFGFESTCGCEQIDIGCTTGGSPGYISACNSASCGGGGGGGGDNGTLTCQCLEIKVFNSEDVELTAEDLADLAAGDVVKFAVRGSASSGAITKARFTINGTLGTEITGKQEINGVSYYVETYTIPDDVTTFSMKAELYHPTALWF